MSETPLIETRSLKKYFDISRTSRLHAVDNINLKIYPGKTLGVVGESGCGKSTLGSTILRLLEPTEGDILYNGKSIVHLNNREMKKMRSNMQIIFQDPYSSLNPRMTVEELIMEYMLVAKRYKTAEEYEAETYRLMEQVGLERRLADDYPHELDGGRLQRIGIARALGLHPKFIVCDEPVSSLDVSIQAQILNLLMDLQDELKLSYMFITHDLSVVKHISDEIMVMYLGECVEYADKNELFDDPLHPYTVALLDALPIAALETHYKKMNLIHGEVSNPIDPKPGCRFAQRCQYATDRCREATPPLVEAKPGHRVACWRVTDGEAVSPSHE